MDLQHELSAYAKISAGVIDIISGTIRVRGERRNDGRPIYSAAGATTNEDSIVFEGGDAIDDIQQPHVLAAKLAQGDTRAFALAIRELLDEYEFYSKG
ncbi:MAG TPA: hypothetical protein PLE60_14965 [Candidatus Latescibacteria bacterium]|nr:hypothetical protein [Candidatus Latescibacterota bacterium]